MRRLMPVLLFAALTAHAALAGETALSWSADGRSVIVADSSRIRIVDAESRRVSAELPGVRHPRLVVAGESGRFAVADPIGNEIAFGTSERLERVTVPDTPVAALWAGDALLVVSRDASVLTRITRRGRTSTDLPADPVAIRPAGDAVAIWSQGTGAVTLLDPETLAVIREGHVPPGASDFETDGTGAYLTYPREGQVIALRLADMTIVERLHVGAVPLDAALEGSINAVSAGRISVADPSSKRVWRIERTQSPLAAFGRAFLRSFIGLGFVQPDSAEAPTGVDRVWSAGRARYALDSSSGAFFRMEGTRMRRLAGDVTPHAISVAPDGSAAFWSGGELRISR